VSPPADRPIFIVGCGRSGTTLLYELLCEHPDLAWFSNYSERVPALGAVAALHRARWLGRPPKGSARSSRWRPHPVEGYRVWDHCTGSLPGGLNRPLDADDLTAEARRRVRTIVRAHVRAQGARRFVNKNTRNARRIPYLHAIFEDARFVHVVRDPRATAVSLTRVAFWEDLEIWWKDDARVRDLVASGCAPLELAASVWAHEVGQVDQAASELPAGALVEVRYEALVAAPEDTVARLLREMELSFDDGVRRALSRVELRAGQVALTGEELAQVRGAAADVAAVHGYELSAP
jgi:hypothetical protein